MNQRSAIYALACILLPVAWGIAVVYVTRFVEKRVTGRHKDLPPVDYHI